MYLTAFSLLILSSAPPTISIEVEGEGYLRFSRDGRMIFARKAELTIAHGRLASVLGPPISPSLFVQGTPDQLVVEPDGTVRVGSAERMSVIGRISLVRLQSTSPELDGFLSSPERGVLGMPGQSGMGTFRSPRGPITAQNQTILHTSSNSPATARLTIRSVSEVAGDTFTLGEIAEIEAAEPWITRLRNVVIGDSPAFGVSRGIDHARIVARLRMAQIPVEGIKVQVPSPATVRRQGQVISRAELVSFAQEHLAKTFSISEATVDGAVTDVFAPLGKSDLRISKVETSGTRLSVLIEVLLDEAVYQTRTLRFTLSSQSFAVRSGDPVTIRLISGGVEVKVRGRAKAQGLRGQTIPVTTQDNLVLNGVILEPGVVEVKL